MWGFGWDGLSLLFGLLLLAGLVLLVLIAIRVFGGGRSQSEGHGTAGPVPGPSRARQILDERYATGELTAEQYREHIRVLNENP